MNQQCIFSATFIILLIIPGIILPVSASGIDILYPLKPSPATGPYEDPVFLANATAMITGLSGKIIPYEGNDLWNLKSEQIRLSRMNISPDFHPNASLINEYLYRIVKAGESYGTTRSLTDHPETLGSPEYDQYTTARGYQADAMKTWSSISSLFPNVTPPKLPDPDRPIKNTVDNSVPSDAPFATG